MFVKPNCFLKIFKFLTKLAAKVINPALPYPSEVDPDGDNSGTRAYLYLSPRCTRTRCWSGRKMTGSRFSGLGRPAIRRRPPECFSSFRRRDRWRPDSGFLWTTAPGETRRRVCWPWRRTVTFLRNANRTTNNDEVVDIGLIRRRFVGTRYRWKINAFTTHGFKTRWFGTTMTFSNLIGRAISAVDRDNGTIITSGGANVSFVTVM